MNRTIGWLSVIGALGSVVSTSTACDLCAVNSANTARAEATGFVFTMSSQHIDAHTLQYQSEPFEVPDQEFMESTFIHLVPGYNFNRDFGVSLNIPLIRREYRLYDSTFVKEEGKVEGLGDISLILRWTPYSLAEADFNFRVNLLAGVKVPTGDTRYLEQDVAEYNFLGIGHNHAFSGVHMHHLTLGTGSVDGVFGLTTFGRWKRLLVTTEAQYYLRTEGKDFTFGDTVMISGGPGVYLFMKPAFSLYVQAVGRYENTETAFYGDIKDTETGTREIYVGPQVGLSLGQHFSANAGADLPLDIRNRGLQVVPDYRVHASVTWSF